jgi:hypothetical protein
MKYPLMVRGSAIYDRTNRIVAKCETRKDATYINQAMSSKNELVKAAKFAVCAARCQHFGCDRLRKAVVRAEHALNWNIAV